VWMRHEVASNRDGAGTPENGREVSEFVCGFGPTFLREGI
jgi:hypothetical protein